MSREGRRTGSLVASDRIFLALLQNAELAELAYAVAPKSPTGRPRKHDAHLMLVLELMVNNRRGLRHHATELGSQAEWNKLRRLARKQARVGFRISKRPPTRAQLLYFHKTFLAKKSTTDALEALLLNQGIALAHALGLGAKATTGTLTTPSREQLVYGDGVIVPSLSVNGRNSSRRKAYSRFHPEQRPNQEHTDGTGAHLHGTKLVTTHIRGANPGERVCLTVGLQQYTDEAKDAVEHFRRAHDAGLGARAVLYDGAIRGVHHDQLIRETGMYVINRINAASRKDDRSKDHKCTKLDDVACTECGTKVKLFATQGALCREEVDASGKKHYVPLAGRRAKRSGKGPFRMYIENSHVCECGHRLLTRYPLHSTPEYSDRGINLPENLRIIPESSDLFRLLKGRRSDAESANDSMKRLFEGRRSRKFSHIATHVEALGYAIYCNVRLGLLVTQT